MTPPLPLALIQKCLQSSPIPELEAYAQDVVKSFAFLIPLGVSTSARELATKIGEAYDLTNPRTLFDYSVLMQVELVLVASLKGVRSGKRPLNAVVVSTQTTEQQG